MISRSKYVRRQSVGIQTIVTKFYVIENVYGPTHSTSLTELVVHKRFYNPE